MHNQLSKQQVFDLSQPCVRDLAWSLWGPALLEHSAPYTEAHHFPLDLEWLHSLDQNSEVLSAYLNNKNTRLLGTYFEALWQFYFSHHPRFKRCINNLQVFKLDHKPKQNPKRKIGKQTLGEFDVLVKEHTHYYHVELTCKFYLELPASSSNLPASSLWLGPNCRDRLDIKYDKTDNKQMPLLLTKQGRETVIQAFNDRSIPADCIDQMTINTFQQIAIWRGHLFDKEHWVKYKNLAAQLAVIDKATCENRPKWIIANKHQWLSPMVISGTEKEESMMSSLQLLRYAEDYFREKEEPFVLISPFMLILLHFDEPRNQWQQSEQFFITANTWPHGELSESAAIPLRPCSPPL